MRGKASLDSTEKNELFDRIFKDYHRQMEYTAFAVLRNRHDAEDAVQDAFIALSAHAELLSGMESFRLYYYVTETARHKAIDLLRKRKDSVRYNDEIDGETGEKDFTENIALKESADGEYEVCFYIGLGEDGVPTSMAFDEICVEFDYSDLPSESGAVIPEFVIYAADAGETIVYADYLVRSGSICSVSTNGEKLTIGSSFGGTEVKSIKSGAVNGDAAPNLVSITVSEGIEEISAGAFSDCGALAEICLPSSLKPGFVGKNELLYSESSIYIREIKENVDLNGDRQIGRPFSSLFENCGFLSAVNIAEGNRYFKSSDGVVYNADGLKIFDPAENREKNLR